MDVFSLLSYINKVSLFAFFITTLVVAYQIYILKKEKTKEKTPSIPDFKEKNNFNVVANFTNLPSSLTKKELKKVNYSKLVFLIISLLTIIIVIFVISLINKNNLTHNQALVNPPAVISQMPTRKLISPTAKIILSPTLIAALSLSLTPTPSPKVPMSPSPAISSSPLPIVTLIQTQLNPTVTSTPSPTNVPKSPPSTEIVLAQTPSLTPIESLNNTSPTQGITNSKLQTLPETGSIGKGLLIIGVAISTIFFSFWF